MHKPAVDSCFDIAFWLFDRALEEGEYLQPQKLHRLMYLTQAYFASARHGAKPMPAVFVIGSDGPFEPNMYRAMERGRPMVDTAIPRYQIRRLFMCLIVSGVNLVPNPSNG